MLVGRKGSGVGGGGGGGEILLVDGLRCCYVEWRRPAYVCPGVDGLLFPCFGTKNTAATLGQGVKVSQKYTAEGCRENDLIMWWGRGLVLMKGPAIVGKQRKITCWVVEMSRCQDVTTLWCHVK